MVLRAFEGLLGLRDGTLESHRDLANRSLTLPEVEAVRAFSGRGLTQIAIMVLLLVGVAIALFQMNWQLALLSMLLEEAARGATAGDPLAPKEPHFAAKAKRVIYLGQIGAPSQFDLWDHKPELIKRDGQPVPDSLDTLHATA